MKMGKIIKYLIWNIHFILELVFSSISFIALFLIISKQTQIIGFEKVVLLLMALIILEIWVGLWHIRFMIYNLDSS